MGTITHVQLTATVDEGDNVRPADQHEQDHGLCTWSIYIGEPGDFSWVADFLEHIDADFFATHLCELHAAQLIRGQA
jgi:hypothetical protein